MSKPDAFATIRQARSLRERCPDAPPSVVLTALTLATFANGRTGTSIRPGYERVASITGLNAQTVKRAVAWLVARGELRRDKGARPGSAACFTWVGGMVVPETPPNTHMEVPEMPNGGSSHTPHQPNEPSLSGLPGPSGGQADGQHLCAECDGPLGYLIEDDGPADEALCLKCFHGMR